MLELHQIIKDMEIKQFFYEENLIKPYTCKDIICLYPEDRWEWVKLKLNNGKVVEYFFKIYEPQKPE